jgi:hypothetical protein
LKPLQRFIQVLATKQQRQSRHDHFLSLIVSSDKETKPFK